MMRILLLITLLTTLTMCQKKAPEASVEKVFDVQGHRGCRGLFPENTLPAFMKALELNVNTLELDLAVSKDKVLVVSHEPYFRAGLSIAPDGVAVTEEDQLNHNIYEMDYEEVKTYDVGSLMDSKHPLRENLKTFKPDLHTVINQARSFAHSYQRPVPDFNIEIKRNPKYDNIYHPGVEEFVNLTLAAVREGGIHQETVIQSFDLESLRLVKSKDPQIRTALLIENEKGADANIKELGFKPDIYSCYFKLLTKEEVELCHSIGVKVIPWTVNSNEDIQAMVDLGVDGIISDYPDRVISIVRI